MGILPWLRYLLEQGSPQHCKCKCQRLIETVVDRFTANKNIGIHPSKIKSVILLKGLHSAWVFGIVFLGYFPFLVPVVESTYTWKAYREGLREFASLSAETYLLLQALATRLPNIFSQMSLGNQIQEQVGDDMEIWSWSHVSPMVDLAVKWILVLGDLHTCNFWQSGVKSGNVLQYSHVNSLLWVYSAVMGMLAEVLKRIIPDNSINQMENDGNIPWLPEFVPKVGLEIIKSRFLSFSDTMGSNFGTSLVGDGSFVEKLCYLRQITEYEISLASRPAPGVGFGWGASGGGFWSTDVLLAQADSRLTVDLLETFLILSISDVPRDEEISSVVQIINSSLALTLIAGPRERNIVDKAFKLLVDVSILKYLDLCIRHFLRLNGRIKLFGWEYKEEDYLLFSKILISHFSNRWLSVKKKLKKADKPLEKTYGSLDTIHEDEDWDASDIVQDSTSLVVEWAHQRFTLLFIGF
ncbi:hypothetical protein L484_022890 [Morus notabilis]|uniref:Uncharacterized protein n=1 Tax=Morus notabilis TaxID=981085 RepID=W9RJM6_9ROSA|nr:hypothetical protein L484_022890 [Morus notabilis]